MWHRSTALALTTTQSTSANSMRPARAVPQLLCVATTLLQTLRQPKFVIRQIQVLDLFHCHLEQQFKDQSLLLRVRCVTTQQLILQRFIKMALGFHSELLRIQYLR
jgi:hypothetical protein